MSCVRLGERPFLGSATARRTTCRCYRARATLCFNSSLHRDPCYTNFPPVHTIPLLMCQLSRVHTQRDVFLPTSGNLTHCSRDNGLSTCYSLMYALVSSGLDATAQGACLHAQNVFCRLRERHNIVRHSNNRGSMATNTNIGTLTRDKTHGAINTNTTWTVRTFVGWW